MADKLDVDDAVASILEESAHEPIIPARKLDIRTTSFLSEVAHTTVNSITAGKDADGDIGRKAAKVCISYPKSEGYADRLVDWVSSFFGDDAESYAVIAYCPRVHSMIPDPFMVAKQKKIWPYGDRKEKKEKFEALVHSLLPTGILGSARFTAPTPEIAEKLSAISPGDWVWVEYGDETNKTNGMLVDVYSKPGEQTPDGSDASGFPTGGAKDGFKKGTPTTPAAGRRPPGPQRPDQARKEQIEQSARQAAQAAGIDPALMLATAQVESGLRDNGWYYDSNGVITFNPYGVQITQWLGDSGFATAKEWQDHGPKKADKKARAKQGIVLPIEQKIIDAIDGDLDAKSKKVASIIKKSGEKYNNNKDMIRISYNAGPGKAREVAEQYDYKAGKLPKWYTGAKKKKWDKYLETYNAA